jgi:hypothetical protein
MSVSRLEQIVHVVVAKPIAWTLYGLWQAARWGWRTAVQFAGWVRIRWTEFRQKLVVRQRAV